MTTEIITSGKLYLRDTITDKKIIKEIGTGKDVSVCNINIIDKNSADAQKLIGYLSQNKFVRVNYENEDDN